MRSPSDIVIGPLGKHDRSGFSCGNLELDDWFRHRAGQDEKRNLARVFVATDRERGVIGFYTLSSFTLSVEEMPAEFARKLPHYEKLPAVLVGRLARDERARGQGLGELLMIDALDRILSAARSIAVFAIAVDAKDDRAIAFYESFGFRPFPARPVRLFLLASEALVGSNKPA